MIIDSVQVGPIAEARDKVLLDTKTYSIEVEDFVSKYGLLKDSFYRELDENLNLTQANYKERTFREVFCECWLGRRLKELGIIKAELPRKKLSMKERMKQLFHISDKEAQTQIKYLTGRALAVKEILANQNNALLLTLIYHRKLEQSWLLMARVLQGKLKERLGLHFEIIGRSRGVKWVLEKDYLIDTCLNSQDNYEKLVNYFLEDDNN